VHLIRLKLLARRLEDECGQTLAEYGLILGLVALAGLLGVTIMVGGVNGLYNTVQSASDCMANMVNGGSCS
jgi:Flp pilus assembly pilin Flp